MLGHEVEVHASTPPVRGEAGRSVQGGRPTLPKRTMWFAKELSRNRAAYRRDAAAIAEFRPDVVLCRQDSYRFSMPLACRKAKVPVVTYADAPVAYESRHFNPSGRWHPGGLVERIERWVLSRSRAVVTVSTPAASILRRYGLRVPIVVAPNGVDVERFHPRSNEERLATRAAFGVGTPLVAGFVGTFRAFHGLGLLGELIQSTASRADLTWLLVGDGPGREELESAVRGLPRVIFTGQQPSQMVSQLLGTIDVLICPHQRAVPEFYFCPLKVLEGMAAGVPCLASDQGDIPDLLAGAGLTLDTDHPAAWTKALTSLLDGPKLRSEMSVAGRMRANRLTWRATATAVESVLVTALKPSAVEGNATDRVV